MDFRLIRRPGLLATHVKIWEAIRRHFYPFPVSERAIALVNAIATHLKNMRDALENYQAQRKPIAEKFVWAATASLSWYERMDGHMPIDPYAFAYRYITRSGRVDTPRRQRIAPRLMDVYNARHHTSSPA